MGRILRRRNLYVRTYVIRNLHSPAREDDPAYAGTTSNGRCPVRLQIRSRLTCLTLVVPTYAMRTSRGIPFSASLQTTSQSCLLISAARILDERILGERT